MLQCGTQIVSHTWAYRMICTLGNIKYDVPIECLHSIKSYLSWRPCWRYSCH